MGNIIITTECVADIPAEIIEKYGIGIIYYTVKTDKGEFRDTDEITASNIMEYMTGGEKKALSIIPSKEDYEAFFKDKLEKHDEIIHISISSGVSGAFENAKEASKIADRSAERIHVIDSRHLSSGQGLAVIEAARLNAEGKNGKEITEYVEKLIPRISTSFITYNADYLYYNGKVSKRVMNLCRDLSLHPVLAMKDGKLTVKKVLVGRYDTSAKRYLRSILIKGKGIDSSVGFITYAGCTNKALDYIHNKVQKNINFDSLLEQPASASISCNCGPFTFGILYIKKE